MAVDRTLVQGPEFTRLAKQTRSAVDKLAAAGWDFGVVPQAFAKNSRADVVAKEIVHIHDGRRMTRVGRLVMGGYGSAFNLMGPIPADSTLRVSRGDVIDVVNQQLPGSGLADMLEFQKLGAIQSVDFYNYTMFYQLEDMVYWLMLHGSGCYPSTLQYMVREFKSGKIVQNVLYSPRRQPADGKPVHMRAQCLELSFASPVVEWMDRPLYGGFAKETIHAETLLTLAPSKLSHPYLDLVDEGIVEWGHQRYHAKRFRGLSQKEGVRGPDVPGEGSTRVAAKGTSRSRKRR